KTQFKEDFGNELHSFFVEDWVFQEDYANDTLNGHFQTNSLKGFGIGQLKLGIIASGAILYYLSETQNKKLDHITSISRIAEEQYVWMDRFTIRNLELYNTGYTNAVSLLDVIDKTISPMGGRMLKRWLALPLKNIQDIQQRHQIVHFFKEDQNLRRWFREQIKQISDLERLISKIATGKINPREVVYLKNSLDAIEPIKATIDQSENNDLKALGAQIDVCKALRDRIDETIHPEAPTNISKGTTIAEGFSEELDELRGLAYSGKDYLDTMLKRETQNTGISSLKIASNNVFGYYIEVRNSHKDKVPEHWIRKQTLVNAERYITEELKEYEAKILGAEEKIATLELQLFNQLVLWMHSYIQQVQRNASVVAQLDCLCGFA